MVRLIVSCLAMLLLVTVAFAPPLEIAYDDGGRIFTTNLEPPQRGGVMFQPSATTYPFRVLWVRVWFSLPGTFEAHLLTNAHLGIHDGTDQVTPFNFTASQTATWDTIDFRSYNVILSENFLFACRWTSAAPQIWGDGSGSGHFWRDNGVGWFVYSAMDPLIRATIETNTGVQMELPPAPLVDGFQIDGVYPNPWNSKAQVRLQISRPQDIHLTMIDLSGRQVMTLWEGTMMAGVHDIRVDGSNLASGMYLLNAQSSSGEASTARCVIIK